MIYSHQSVRAIAHQAVFQPGDFGMQTVWPSWAMSKMKVTTLPLRHGSGKSSDEPSCGYPECTYPLRAHTENKSTCHRLWWISKVALLPVLGAGQWEQRTQYICWRGAVQMFHGQRSPGGAVPGGSLVGQSIIENRASWSCKPEERTEWSRSSITEQADLFGYKQPHWNLREGEKCDLLVTWVSSSAQCVFVCVTQY